MGEKVLRIILGIAIVGGLFTGLYFILPGEYQDPITAFGQKQLYGNAYTELTDLFKGCTVPKHKDVTWDAAMNGKTKNPVWLIKKAAVDDAGNGDYEVYCNGYKCTVSYESDENSDSMITHTNARVRLVFRVHKEGSKVVLDRKEVQAGKSAYPDEIRVEQTIYGKTANQSYYKQIMEFLAGP